jgi:nucleotide-binding universal stress UspA family protein
MFEQLRTHYHTLSRRLKRIERRELHEVRHWVEQTRTLTRLSVLVFVPVLIAVITWLSNSLGWLSFLVFPPLAASTYTLFSDPTGRYSSPWQFVAGLTLGALAGWVALEVSALVIYHVRPAAFHLGAASAALGIVLTAIVTWALDIDLPTAYSTALLVLVTNTTQFAYVVFVALMSTVVALVFVGWRTAIYDQRAHYLYPSTTGNDQVLAVVDEETPASTAWFGARLAAAHEAGTLGLLATVADPAGEVAPDQPLSPTEDEAATLRRLRTDPDVAAHGSPDAHAPPPVASVADQLRASIGVACDVLVARNGPTVTSPTIQAAVQQMNSDLIVTPYNAENGTLSPVVWELFRGSTDVIALRTTGSRTEWPDVLVAIRTAGPLAHSMIEFASRLTGEPGMVHVCTCITDETQRRQAERMLATAVEGLSCAVETHVSQSSIETFLDANAGRYDLIMLGASTDRTTASRLFSPPTHQRLQGLDCDVAVVHHG